MGGYTVLSEEDAPAQSSSGYQVVGEEDAPPAKVSPEVSRAVSSVPRPTAPEGLQPTELERAHVKMLPPSMRSDFPLYVPTDASPQSKSNADAYNRNVRRANDALGEAVVDATGVPGVVNAARYMADGYNPYKPISDTNKPSITRAATGDIRAASSAITPLLGTAAVEKPLSTAALVGGGYLAEKGARAALHGKVSPDTEDLLAEGAQFAPMAVAAAKPFEALPSEPGARAESLFRNIVYKAGGNVPENPTYEQAQSAYRAAISNLHPDVNPAHAEDARNLNKAWTQLKNSGRFSSTKPATQPTPAQPSLPGEVADAASSMVRANTAETAARATVQGVPIPPPVAPVPAPEPPSHIAPETVKAVGEQIATLPPDQRADALISAHGELSKALLAKGKVVGPDGKLEIIKTQDQADSVAQRIINDEVARQDKAKVSPTAGGGRSAEEMTTQPASSPASSVASSVAATRAAARNVNRASTAQQEVSNVEPNVAATGNSQPVQADNTVPPRNEQFKVVGEEPAPQPFNKGDKVQVAGVETPAEVKHISDSSGVRVVRLQFAEPTKVPWSDKPVTKTSVPKKYQDSIKAAGEGQIILARHGETKLDQPGANETVAGHSPEPLDDRGVKSAEKLAEDLKDKGVTQIVTSDLPRAAQTASIVGEKLDIPVKEDGRLRPQSVPETEGMKVGEAKPIWEHYAENPTERPEGGETHNEFEKRQEAALKEVRESAKEGERPLVVTHSRNIEHEVGTRPEPGEFVESPAEKNTTPAPGKVGETSTAGEYAASRAAERYYEAQIEKTGSTRHLDRVLSLEGFIKQEAVARGIVKQGENYELDNAGLHREAARRVSERQSRIGRVEGKGGTGLSDREAGEGKATPGTGEGGLSRNSIQRSPERSGQDGHVPGQTASRLESTQPIGLSDDELQSWAKSKSFAVEPAGEQLDLFGQPTKVFRVSRTSGGERQSGLVYENQLDRLGLAKEKQQASLFSPARDESGSFEPGKIAEAATKVSAAVGDYIRSASDATHIARGVQRGLETLDTQKQADVLRGKQLMEKAFAGGLTKADDEAIYHHLENPEEPLTDSQETALDDLILPLREQNTALYKEASQGGVPLENYVGRVVKDKGGLLDRIAQGARAIGKKNTLSRSAPQLKTRSMMAIESPDGERRVVSIKGGEAIMWDAGEPTKLGPVKSAKGAEVVGDETMPASLFFDKGYFVEGPDGYDWKLTQATTKEIEAATNLRYYHSALASLVSSNIQLRSVVRAQHFLEALKDDEDFKRISQAPNSGKPPQGWRTTALPQFHGYYFEPRTAEVLDKYYERIQGGDATAYDKVGAFMRVAMLVNPIMHPMNVAGSWAVEKGVTGYLPQHWATIAKTGSKAVKAVLSQNDDFLEALDSGGALQSQNQATADLAKLFFDQLAEGAGKNESWAVRTLKALGLEHGNALGALHKFSSKIAWLSNDIFLLQSAYQFQAEHPGTSLGGALEEVGRIIPEYRLPTRIADSKAVADLMRSRWATIFGAYHYGLLRSFGEIGRSALGLHEPAAGQSKASDVGKGWDRLALIGLIAFALYPAFDELAKKISGDKHAHIRRAGPFGLVDAAQGVIAGTKDASQAAQQVVTPAPHTKAAIEAIFNRDLYTGREIRDPHATWEEQAGELGRWLLQQVGQLGQAYRASESESGKRKFLLGQIGVQLRRTKAEKLAADIAASRMSVHAETPEERETYAVRHEILDALRKGDDKPMEKALAEKEINSRQAHLLRERAKLTPLQDKVRGFSYSDLWKVYQAANDDEKKELQGVLRQKRARMFERGRGSEVERAEAR